MSWWRLCGLTAVVIAGHVWIIHAFEKPLAFDNKRAPDTYKTSVFSISLSINSAPPLIVPQAMPPEVAEPMIVVQQDRDVSAMHALQTKQHGMELKREDFLDPEMIDDVAVSPGDFGTILQSTLSQVPGPIDIELWIDGNGNVLNAFCVGIECTDTLAADSKRLIGLVFRPAKKNGAPVASRKVIRVEPLPAPGF